MEDQLTGNLYKRVYKVSRKDKDQNKGIRVSILIDNGSVHSLPPTLKGNND